VSANIWKTDIAYLGEGPLCHGLL